MLYFNRWNSQLNQRHLLLNMFLRVTSQVANEEKGISRDRDDIPPTEALGPIYIMFIFVFCLKEKIYLYDLGCHFKNAKTFL